jgi:hypothetical protein
MLRHITKYQLTSLIITAIICGLIWRFEVEYHGWKGLTWLSYFHYAIPLAFGLFLLWANFFIQTNLSRRIAFNLIAILYCVLIYYFLTISLTYNLIQGPSAFILVMDTPPWKLVLFKYSLFLLLPLIPTGAYFILKLFRQKTYVRSLVFAIIGIIISVPLSTLILMLINHKGGHDYIHSIKSGVLIPLWTVSVGLLFIGLKNSDNPDSIKSR